MPVQFVRVLLIVLCLDVVVCGSAHPFSVSEPGAWALLLEAGGKAREEARYGEAERLLTQALQEAEQMRSNDHRVATAANNLGLLYHDLGRLTEARLLYERALTVWQEQFGTEYVDVAAALNNLAEIAHAEGDWLKAEPCVRWTKPWQSLNGWSVLRLP